MKKKVVKKKEYSMSREEYIEHLSCKSNEIHISNNNSKTGILCNSLAMPTCTCRDDAPCKASGCYCMKGTQSMCNVVAAYMRNLRLYNSDPNDFWEQVRFKIRHNPLPLFRWFDAGDIPDYDFFCEMVNLAKDFPDIKFMTFTKKYDIVNRYCDEYTIDDIPDNFNIMFSAWHACWYVDNRYEFPVAYVDFKDENLNPYWGSNFTTCPNQHDRTITCSTCQKCWNVNVKTVVFKQH